MPPELRPWEFPAEEAAAGMVGIGAVGMPELILSGPEPERKLLLVF